MTEIRFGRHPKVAAVFAVGVGILLLSLVMYRLLEPVNPSISTLAFVLAIFGVGIMTVSGVWYISLFVGDLL